MRPAPRCGAWICRLLEVELRHAKSHEDRDHLYALHQDALIHWFDGHSMLAPRHEMNRAMDAFTPFVA